MSKKRIQLKLENSDKIITVAWYIGTPQPNIIELIKQAFGFGSAEAGAQDIRMIGLYDLDGDLVVLSDSIPNDQIFTVKFLVNEQQYSGLSIPQVRQSELNLRPQGQNMNHPEPINQKMFPPQGASSNLHTRKNSFKSLANEGVQNQANLNDDYFNAQNSPSYMLKGHQPQYQDNQYQSWNNQQNNYMQQQFYDGQLPPMQMNQQQYYEYQDSQFRGQGNMQQMPNYPPDYWQGYSQNMRGQPYEMQQPFYQQPQNFSPRQSPTRGFIPQQMGSQPQSVRMQPTRFSPTNQNTLNQYNNLQAMGMGLRGGRKMSPNQQSQNPQQNQMNKNQLVDDKRNHLKNIIQGDMNNQKGINGTSSQTSSQESADQVMSLKNGDNRMDQMDQNNNTLLNTPLANTMKKVGMTPNLNSKLNQFVVRKPNNPGGNNTNFGSPLVSMNRDGTGGPQGSMEYRYQNQMPMMSPQFHQQQQQLQNQESYSSSQTQDYLRSQIGDVDDLMAFNDNMGSPRSMFYSNQQPFGMNVNYQRNIHSDEAYSMHGGDFSDIQQQLPSRQQRQQQPMFRQQSRPNDKNVQPDNMDQNY